MHKHSVFLVSANGLTQHEFIYIFVCQYNSIELYSDDIDTVGPI